MKNIPIILILLSAVLSVEAKVFERSLVEIGPKATLYIDEDTRLGIALEAVVNPLRNVGFRLDLTEILFDPTTFYFNRESSLDAFVYLSGRKLQLYVLLGVGLKAQETGAETRTDYSIRGGLGLNHSLNPKTKLFIEPAVIVSGNGDTDVSFRISAGGRFGIIE